MKKFLAASLALTFLGTLAQNSVPASSVWWFLKKPEEVIYTYEWYNAESCREDLLDFETTVMEKLRLLEAKLPAKDQELKTKLAELFKGNSNDVVPRTFELLTKYNKQKAINELSKIFNLAGHENILLPELCFKDEGWTPINVPVTAESKEPGADDLNKNDNNNGKETVFKYVTAKTIAGAAIVVTAIMGIACWMIGYNKKSTATTDDAKLSKVPTNRDGSVYV